MGAVATGVAVASSGSAGAAAVRTPLDAHEEILVHVKDPRTGRLVVMVEGREIEIVDHQLVARLVHAIAQGA